MIKRILAILLMLTMLPQAFAQNKEPITEAQAVDIAKRYVICNGIYAPSEVEGTKSGSFSEETNSWFVVIFKETPDGGAYDDSDIYVSISPEGEVIHISP